MADKKKEIPKTCAYCKHQPMCKAHWDMVTAMSAFARIDSTKGQTAMAVMRIMGEACSKYEKDSEV